MPLHRSCACVAFNRRRMGLLGDSIHTLRNKEDVLDIIMAIHGMFLWSEVGDYHYWSEVHMALLYNEGLKLYDPGN